MKNESQKTISEKTYGIFETLPLAEQKNVSKDGADNPIPSEEATEIAREWVDFKEM